MKTTRGLIGLVALMLLAALAVAACGGATPTSEPEMAKADTVVISDTGSSAADSERSGDDTAAKDSEEVMKEGSGGETEAKDSEDMMKEGSGSEMAAKDSEDMMVEESGNEMDAKDSENMMKEESGNEMDAKDSEGMMEKQSDGEMDAKDSDGAMMEDSTAMESGAELLLDVAGLENLGEGWAYEGWLIVDGVPVSTGSFVVDDNGMPSATAFGITADNLGAATAFVLTIEPVPDQDPAPSSVHVLGGDLVDSSASLSVGHAAALGNDFAAASASYILGIPSSDSASDSYTSGIWFNKLDLPVLPEGWIYEGWVAGADGPISTGRFATDKEADSDGNGPTAGPKAGPSFPGQDFLNPAIDLTSGYAAVISIEPVPDNSPAPFFLKPLIDKNIEDVGDHGSQGMENMASGFPSGSAMLKVMDSEAKMGEKDAMDEEMAAVDLPDWFSVELIDVNSGEAFTIAGFEDKVLLVETMAIWCSNCLRQQKEVKALHEALGDQDGLVTVVLDIDPNEDADNLEAYAAKYGFDWIYAVAPREVAREIGQLYGDQYLNPPSTPMLIIDRHGEVHLLPFGRKTAGELQQALEPFLNSEM